MTEKENRMNSERLEASARVALGAFLHDLGKFAERAAPGVDAATLETHLQLYCPRHERPGGGFWYSHKHAAYTALAVDWLEEVGLPPLKGWNMAPFADWKSRQVDDSLVNAAARHHRPETFLQWLIATADRVASGFEREQFEAYNRAEKEETATGKNHYQARLLTLFESIRLESEQQPPERFAYRYPLRPLSPDSLFPVKRDGYEPAADGPAQKEYAELWAGFLAGLANIPESHRHSLPLWLDHFDTLWQTYTQVIPSATAFGVKPEVPLYDHSKTTAALAVALWRYHADHRHEPAECLPFLKNRGDWDEPKFLLVQGDFFGIQKFIFAGGGDTKKKAAKLLRGRSFYVSLIAECAALKVLDALDLPSTNQITNAAGKFLIVAPNTQETQDKLTELQKEFDAWFLSHSYGEAGLGLAFEPARCNDFLAGKDGESRFGELMKRLHRTLERAKYRHFGLCGDGAREALFGDYLESFNNTMGACAVNDRAPAEKEQNGVYLSRLAADQIRAGELLVKCERLILSTRKLQDSRTLDLPIFGYHVHFTGGEEDSGKFGAEVRNGNIRRLFDFSMPDADPAKPLWNGYARRNIRGYVPVFEDREWADPRYGLIRANLKDDEDEFRAGDLKTLHHIACEDLDAQRGLLGVAALHTLKGDIDDLGAIFQRGVKQPTFAKMAALSRQVNNFFAVYLPWLCRTEYGNSYTVFAGGDDFFLIGPWKSQLALALRMRREFMRYVAENPELHFSAGLAMTKPAVPIHYLAEGGEDALEAAKKHRREQKESPSKNAVTCFGQTVGWEGMEALWGCYERLEALARQYELSTAYLYGLLGLADMAETMETRRDDGTVEFHPEKALWRSRLAYRTHRMVLTLKNLDREQQKALSQTLAAEIATAIERFKGAYKIALHLYLYQQRD
jgi:CRISPR-associated protein Csm1